MNKESILKRLNEHRAEIIERFGLKTLALFGSAARDELQPDSDVDILVEFEGPMTFDGYMDLKFFLEDLLQKNVDLVTNDGLRPRMRPIIERDLIHVA